MATEQQKRQLELEIMLNKMVPKEIRAANIKAMERRLQAMQQKLRLVHEGKPNDDTK